MAEIHKISGYVVDIDESFTEIELKTIIESGDWFTHHLSIETVNIGEWEDDNPLNYHNCDLAECDKWFYKEPPSVPVKHGKWVDRCVRDWHCSECGKKVPRQVYFDGYCYDDKLNYCPNCGARMDGE